MTISNSMARLILAGGLASTALIGPAAFAQVDDIVVTAQRREERLIDVPIAVSAVTSESLERASVQNLNNVQSLIPNIQMNQTVGNSFSPVISIRGLAPSADTSMARDQPVGLYLDGVPISKSTGAAFDTIDLARVEVLRGPQGTLYGKNTIGGAINMISQRPTGEIGGQVYLSYGSWNELRRRASVDLPAFGNVKIKLGYSGRDTNGYWRNAARGKKRYFGEQSLNAGRVDVLWEPSDNFSARYVYDISDAVGTPTMLALSGPGSYSFLVQNYMHPTRPGRNDVSADNTIDSNFRTTGHALTLEYNFGEGALGDVTLKSITARRTMRSRSSSDFDGTPIPYLSFTLNNDYKAFSQELQLLGSGSEVHYTLGGFFWDDDYDVYNPRWNFISPKAPNFDLSDRGGGSRSYAAYGSVTWSPGFADGKLDLTAGLRWTKERKKARELFIGNSAYLANPNSPGSGVFERLPDGTPVTQSGGPVEGARPGSGGPGPYDLIPLAYSRSWSQVNPEFNIVLKPQQDWSFYGRVATGFKSGGINDTAATNIAFLTPYNPEKLLSFEAGTKFSSPDRRLNLNLAFYHSIYKNFQAGVFVPELVTTNIINAGKAKFSGIEAEGSIRLLDQLSLNFGGGYLKARYTEFLLPTGEDVTDTYNIPLAPKWNYLVGGVFTQPLGGANLEVSANWSWRSRQAGSITPDPNNLAYRRAYGVLDGKIGLTDIELGGGNNLEIALWGKNITDTKYWNSGIDLQTWALRQWADPRSYGVEARVRF